MPLAFYKPISNTISSEQEMSQFVPNELRLGRLRRRLSQTELAEKVGLSSTTICRIEQGKKVPTPDEIQAIAQALNEVVDETKEGADRDVISKLSDNRKRLRIEIGIEEMCQALGPTINGNSVLKPSQIGASVVFYLALDELGVSTDQLSEEDVQDEIDQYPRER